MTEQMNVPKLRFAEFDNQWKSLLLGEITSYLKGFAFKSEDYLEKGESDSRLIRVSDLSSDSVKLDNQKVFLPSQLMENSTKYKLQNDDVLITTVGSKPELRESAVGRAIYINEAHGFLNQNLLIMRPKGEHTPKFLFSQLNTPRYINHITNIQRGNANQSNITVVDLFEYRVSTTSTEEQQKIASFLSKVDEKIALLVKKKDKLTEYKKGVMQQLFNGKWEKQDGQLTFIPPTLRFKADDGSEFPDWEEKALIELAAQRFSNGVFNDPKRIGKGYRLINVKDMYSGNFIDTSTLSLLDLSEKEFSNNQVKYGDIFFTRSSLVPSGIAYSNVNLSNENDITYDGHLIKFSPKLDIISPYYFANYLRSHSSRKSLISRGKQSTMTTIGQEDIKDIRFLIPSLEEQIKIANFLSAIDQKVDLTNSELEKAKEWKKGLLQQMFV